MSGLFFLRSFVCGGLAAFFCFLCSATGREIEVVRSLDDVYLHFPHDVVSREAVYASIGRGEAAQALSCVECGGDAAYRPSMRWAETNVLRLEPKTGTPAGTRFTVHLKPGTTYTDGTPATQEEAEVRFYPPYIRASIGVQLPQGCGAVVGAEADSNVLLSAASGLRFLLTEQVEHKSLFGDTSYTEGRTVSAHAEPATLRHGVSFALLAGLQRHVSFTSLREDAPLPTFLLVVPDEPLPDNSRWLIRYTTDQQASPGGKEWHPLGILHSMRGLRTSLEKEKTSAGETEMTLRFSSPLSPAVAEKLFRTMALRVGYPMLKPNESPSAEAGAATVRGGVLTRTAQLGEHTVRVSFLGRAEDKDCPEVGERGDYSVRWRYDNPSLCSAVRLRVQADVPCTLELALPQGGAESVHGVGLEETMIHRLSHGAQAPCADVRRMGWGPRLLSLPRGGAHRLHVTTGACARLAVSAHYWSPAEVTENRAALAELMSQRYPASSAYDTALENARYHAELTEEEADDDERVSCRRRYDRSRRRALRSGCPIGTLALNPPDGRRVATAEWPVDLDELAGGKAAPGLYVLHLRALPEPAACAAAEALGLSADDVAEERDIWVQVTGLSLLAKRNVVVLQHLEDGSLSETAVLRQSDTNRSIPVVNGYADAEALPSPDEDAWYLAQEGDDVCMAPCFSRDTEHGGAESSLRGRVLSDRTHYRPGEEVHLFGLLRRVTGDEARVARDNLIFTVKKPDGSRLTEKTIRPDAYGAFEVSFRLPEEGEDVTGTYCCCVDTPSGSLSCTNAEVQCEVFRRDSFEIEFESDLPLLCPQRYSCTVKARDYNGSPLAGAKVELKLSADLAIQGGHREASDTERYVLTATSRTDAAGCAHFSCPLSLPSLKGSNTPERHLFAEVSVTNDRGEVKRAVAAEKVSYADFRLAFKDFRLYAFRSQQKAGDARNLPLPRAQKLHARLLGKKEEATRLPNGFVRLKYQEGELWGGDVVIPAHAACGAAFPLDEETLRKMPGDTMLELSGTDGAGRSYRSVHPLVMSLLSGSNDVSESPALMHKEGTCFSVDVNEGGEVCVLMQSRGQVQTARRSLHVGKQDMLLPEAEPMTGRLRVTLIRPVRGEGGLYREAETMHADCFRSDAERCLDIDLDVPTETPRPGSELTLRGRVSRRADGKAADARILLYAVDKGMLSVGGAPTELPNWEEIFTGALSVSPIPAMLTLPKSFDATSETSTLEGLWRGECLRDGKWGFVRTDCSVGHDEEATSDRSIFDILMPFGQQQQYAPSAAAAPEPGMAKRNAAYAACPAPVIAPCMAEDALPPWETEESTNPVGSLRLREDFSPLAVWAAQLRTDREGRFETTFTLPDTLTTYALFCVAAAEDGNAFGNHTEELEVSQPVMLTPGTPLFMSAGDRLLLPLTITNGTKQADTWQVSLSTGARQSIRLEPKATGTLFFELAPQEEGECVLRWEARANSGSDAVEGRFPVRYPAPLLKETHRVVLDSAALPASECRPSSLLSADLASSVRGECVVELSANPLMHLAGCADFVLEYPYGCTEQTASALLPWILYERLSPVCPQMAAVSPEEARERAERSIDALFERQQSDGGLAYWAGGRTSCFWASAHAALVLTYAKEQGFSVPRRAMRRLREYLATERERRLRGDDDEAASPLVRYETARVLGETAAMRTALMEASAQAEKDTDFRDGRSGLLTQSIREDVAFMLALRGPRAESHAAFMAWMRARARDRRHPSTWSSSWPLLALCEYLSDLPSAECGSRIILADGRTIELGQGITTLPLARHGQKLGGISESIRAAEGTTYLTLRAKALPNRTSYAGRSDKGLKLTRRYEVQGANGQWHAASSFAVGDVVRVTLTCTKIAKDMHYLVLEDYLPSCMEAVNPHVPSQAAGIDFTPWSPCFDNREYLTDRVRGFCTRWEENKPVSMIYYARVKRAGSAIAAPAQAQLMYEPQIYALTPNTTVTCKGEK